MGPNPRVRFALGVLTFGLMAAAPARAAEWRWSVTPYLWGAGIGADVSVNGQEVVGQRAELTDVLDGLDFVIQVHTEGQRGAHGVLLDLTYLDFGDDGREKRVRHNGIVAIRPLR